MFLQDKKSVKAVQAASFEEGRANNKNPNVSLPHRQPFRV
jgi:hypothetical protein